MSVRTGCLRNLLLLIAALALNSCGGGGGGSTATSGGNTAVAPTAVAEPILDVKSVTSTAVATFSSPWAMTFLPDGRMLVTERSDVGRLWLVSQGGISLAVSGISMPNHGLLDVVLHPLFASNRLVYLTYLEPGSDDMRVGRGAGDPSLHPEGLALAVGTLTTTADGARIDGLTTIWRQSPKIVSFPGSGEPGGRIAFSPDGAYLFVAAGDRQEFEPVQTFDNTLGKIVRLLPDGSVPRDNPFVGRPGAMPEIWTLGHRNPYGLAFDAAGRLWEHEMGPKGGDELNLIVAGANYGWPLVSYGSAYTGEKYPDPKPGDGFALPALYWDPVIAPAGMIFYSGSKFAAWRGDALLGGLQSQGLVRVRITGTTGAEMQRISLGARTREVKLGPDGAIWVLEDAPTGRLLRLDPVF